MAVSAASTDGAAHSVQVYSDISAEWVSGDNTLAANWSTSTAGNIVTHQVQLQSQVVLSEVNDYTQYGSTFYSTPNTANTTYQSGADLAVRAQFINTGKLLNTQDINFRPIQDNWPVFGLAHDLGSVIGASSPVLFSIGHVRDPALRYIVEGGDTQPRSLYFWSQFNTVSALISSFLGDYSAALSRANAFDSKVNSDARKISTDYASIVDLSIRQSIGSTEITITKNSDGTWNTSDIIVFMKEISSDGNINTVDVIFPAWPVLMYLNPALGKYLLEGLFRYQASGLYPNKWSVHDLGSSYPKALGHNDGNDEAMPVEESGNMLIMSLNYAQKTGDHSHLTRFTGLLDQWTQFLITDSLIPANQLSTDDFAGHLVNQTNLAIKGIIGIKAMSEIYTLLGNTAQSSNYSSIAASYVTSWQTLSASSSGQHLTLNYGDSDRHVSALPGRRETAWYKTVQQPYGVPLDTRHTYTKSDWEIWTAGIVTDTATRDFFISSVKKYASDGKSSQPFGDWYETSDGTPEGFRARPVVGGHLGTWGILLSKLAGWSGFIRIDGTAYNFLGAPHIGGATPLKARQKSSEFTSTQSIFVLSAGPVDVTVTFLSPIEAKDLVKQSIPFSYMAVSATPTDGKSHSVQLYSDITAEWTSGDDSNIVKWTTSETKDSVTHQIQRQYPAPFSEVDDHAECLSFVS
ncbi:hypothetical protein H0H87_007893 [Tephrocybe sp. NHM501043]|nr:hypothetical protein H0H87_007893 [Tephrocybe sp. NHM501043]